MEQKGIHQWDSIYPIREDFVEDIPKGTLYIAEVDEEMIGVYVISEEADEAYAKCAWENPDRSACILHRFCISPNHQIQGWGRKILQYIEKQEKDLSYASIRRDVFTQNPHAVNLYKKRGYHNCPTVGAVHSVLLLFNRFWGYTGLIHAQPVEESICMIFSLFLLFTRPNEVSEKNQ